MEGCTLISNAEYQELTLKAWKYDKLREKAMRTNCFNDIYIPTEIDIHEATPEEIQAIRDKRKQEKKEREESEAF